MLTLDQLQAGNIAIVTAVQGEPALVQRLYELGLMEGEQLEFLTRAPLGDPLEIRFGNSRLSLRRNEAQNIQVRLVTIPAMDQAGDFPSAKS